MRLFVTAMLEVDSLDEADEVLAAMCAQTEDATLILPCADVDTRQAIVAAGYSARHHEDTHVVRLGVGGNYRDHHPDLPATD